MLKRKLIYKTIAFVRKVRDYVRNFIEELNLIQNVQAQTAKGITTTYLVNKIYKFCQLYSEINFYPYQEQFSKRIIRSILENDGEELTALFSRQTGKSETVATTVGGLMIILPELAKMPMFADDKRFVMFKNGLWVGLFAPSLVQAQTTYNRMRTRLSCPSAIAVLEEFGIFFSTSNGETVALSNGSFCTSKSASDKSNIEGGSYKLIICEECQDISTFKIRKSISPMGASYNATMVKIGTPTTFKGDFYEAIERNKKLYAEKKINIRNHFEYNYLICMKYNPKYAKYIEKEKFKLGEFSDEFRMSYTLEWILERGMFIDEKLLENLCGDKDANRVHSDLTKSHVVGIDLAKKGDSTVVTVVEVDWDNPTIFEEEKTDSMEAIEYVAYETKIKDWMEITDDNYDKQYYSILQYLRNFNVKRIMIDATKEEGMSDRLSINLPNVDVVPCVFSSQFKSEMYKHLESSIKCGRAKYPNSPEVQQTREYQKFKEQMIDLEKDFRGQLLVVHHPNVRGAHDDYPDSWALAVYGAKEKSEDSEIETSKDNKMFNNYNYAGNNFYNSRNSFTARRR